ASTIARTAGSPYPSRMRLRNRPPTGSPVTSGFAPIPSPKITANSVSPAIRSAPMLCTALCVRSRMCSSPIVMARPTHTCRPSSAGPPLAAKDAAVFQGGGDWEKEGDQGKQHRPRLDHAQRPVVGAPPQQDAREPERSRRHTIAVEQPVEDRRFPDRVA